MDWVSWTIGLLIGLILGLVAALANSAYWDRQFTRMQIRWADALVAQARESMDEYWSMYFSWAESYRRLKFDSADERDRP